MSPPNPTTCIGILFPVPYAFSFLPIPTPPLPASPLPLPPVSSLQSPPAPSKALEACFLPHPPIDNRFGWHQEESGFFFSTISTPAMLKINDHMHKIWKSQVEEKSLQSSVSSWIMNLPFDTKVKDWLAVEERYKQDIKMKNILPAVANKFLKLGCHNCITFGLVG